MNPMPNGEYNFRLAKGALHISLQYIAAQIENISRTTAATIHIFFI